MAHANDLCSLAMLKGWLGQSSSDEDVKLGMLISGASGLIYSYLNRSSIILKTYSEVYDSIGRNGRLMLPNYPVVSIGAISINGTALAAAPLPGPNSFSSNGYLLNDVWDGNPPGNLQSVSFFGCPFPIGRQAIAVTYSAGYTVQNEAHIVPATANGDGVYQVYVAAPNGPWAADIGVGYAIGDAPLTRVTGTPSVGQYALDPGNAGGYLFAAADQSAAVLISYSFIPASINQACMEIASERFKYKSHIGEVSVSTSGIRTTSYSKDAMSPYVKALLASYIRVVPF